jgi:uroporphyrinogen-III synthase
MYEYLAGKIVILTREPTDNRALRSRLRGRVAEIVELPCIRTERLADIRGLAAALAGASANDWIVVTSRHGAEAVARCGPTRADIAAIGDATARRLREVGLRVAFQPSVPSGAMLARELPARGGVVVLARSDRALPDLPALLRDRGFDVREMVAYRTVAEARGEVARVRGLLEAGAAVAVLFHSPSAVEGMVHAIDPALLRRASIYTLGHSTLRAVHDVLGVDADVSLIEEEAAHVAHR